MALLWMEGFETYKAAEADIAETELTTRWARFAGSASRIVPGRTAGTFALRSGSVSGAGVLETPIIANHAEIYMGFAFYVGNAVLKDIIVIRDKFGEEKCALELQTDGDLRITSVFSGDAIEETTTTTPISDDTWHWIELYVKFDDSAGAWILKVDGIEEMNTSGVDTRSSFTEIEWAYVEFLFPAPSVIDDTFRFDDIYINDGAGSVNNGFLGDVLISKLAPNGDTATQDFTGSAGGDQYLLIDEQDPNDADYVESSTDAHANLHDFENLSGAGQIYGIDVRTRAHKTAPDDVRYISKAKSDTTTSDASAEPVSSEVRELGRIIEVDPDTGSLWTEAGLNAAQFGFGVNKP